MPLQRLIRDYFLKHYYFLVGRFLRYVKDIWLEKLELEILENDLLNLGLERSGLG